MYQFAIPTCYFPSTVFFVDDSRDFLVNFTLQLEDDLAYRMFDSPYDALEALYATAKEVTSLDQRCVSENFDSTSWPMNTQSVNLDLVAIHSEVYNPQRFSEVSVVVVDYAMPGMNGLEFCQRISNSPVKKILLTGKADEKTVLDAFNEGIIDRYIEKNDPNVADLIKEAIHKLQRQYFQSMSDMITKMLIINSPNCLQDPKFADFFKQLSEENNIVEFYLTENSGSFLMIDNDGSPSCLIVKNRQDLDMHYDLALDNKAPENVLKDLKAGKKIPYFCDSSGDQLTEWTDWSTTLYPAKTIEGEEKYFYAYVKDSSACDVQKEKIYPYNEYLDNMEVDEF